MDGPAPVVRRWWQRALPVGGVAVVALAAGALALPQDEVRLSTSRERQEFVELFVPGRPQAACAPDATRVRFRVTSHLDRTSTLRFRVAAGPAGAPAGKVAKPERLRLSPGETRTVRAALPSRPAGAHDITIRLQQRPERLRIHCDAGARQREVAR